MKLKLKSKQLVCRCFGNVIPPTRIRIKHHRVSYVYETHVKNIKNFYRYKLSRALSLMETRPDVLSDPKQAAKAQKKPHAYARHTITTGMLAEVYAARSIPKHRRSSRVHFTLVRRPVRLWYQVVRLCVLRTRFVGAPSPVAKGF